MSVNSAFWRSFLDWFWKKTLIFFVRKINFQLGIPLFDFVEKINIASYYYKRNQKLEPKLIYAFPVYSVLLDKRDNCERLFS